ncbi:DMT family transporter [Sulfitobacter sp. JB4-11]|uniref:DMT family transporter n=1 Tax=Sulfitobacter rhodophyticola TaxID=3238304 RepID=UPI003D81A49C
MTGQAAPDNRYGAILLIAAAAVFTADVTVLRFLSPEVPFAQIIFFRSLCQLGIVAVWITFTKRALFRSGRKPQLVVRGLTSLVCWWLYYASFQTLDLALASTLTFTTSLFVVALAPLVLGERLGPLRGLTTVLGFFGVLLASEVQGLTLQPGILFGLGSAFAASILIFQNRVLARTEHTATIMVWIGLVASIGTLPSAVLGWTILALGDVVLLLSAGTLATLGMLFTVEAYRHGEVSALATFPYVRILFALGAGYFLFSETASLRELAGAAIIVVCGLLAREHRRSVAP